MRTFKRVLSLLLAALLLLGMLVSCQSEPPAEQNTPDTTAPGENVDTTASPTEEERIPADLPDVRYDGYDYRVRVKGEAVHWSTIGIYAEDKTGEPVNDATLERNNIIEQKYGAKVSTIEGTGVSGAVTQAVLSQVDEFDLAIITADNLAAVAPKSVYDLKQLKYIDLEKPWYDQNFNESVSLGGRLYATTGDLLLNDDNGTWCTLFNKRIAEDYHIEDLYKLVFDGKWTLDKAYELAKLVTKEDTGDDVMDYNDLWGFVNESYNAYAIVSSTGEKIASKGDDDLPIITANTEKFQTVFSKAVDILGDKSVCALTSDWNDPNYENPFLAGRGLFVLSGLYALGHVRGIDDEIGVLPMPKYEESQPIAYSPITVYNFTMCCIPITVSDVERTSILTEAMFAESRYTTRIAFYETTLKKKYSPDEETKLVLDRVIENRTYDLGAIYGWGSVVNRLGTLMSNRTGNFASQWKSLERVVTSSMNKMIKDFNKAQNVES